MDQFLAQFPVLIIYLLAVVSIVGLVVLSKQLVEGSIGLAKQLAVNPFIVSTTIIGIGTSLDELVVNINGLHLPDYSEIVMGNIVGSIIANFTLGLGLPALIATIAVPSTTVKKELFIFAQLLIMLNVFAANGQLTFIEGCIFLVATLLILIVMYQHAHQNPKRTEQIKQHLQRHQSKSVVKPLVLALASLVGLLASAKLLIHSSLIIAESLHISSYIASMLIVGLGTSLPEILASLQGILKKSPEIVLGNVLGSNIFIFCVGLGVPMVFKNIAINPQIATDIRLLNFLTIGIIIFLFIIPESRRSQKIASLVGGCLLVLSFLVFVIQKTKLFG